MLFLANKHWGARAERHGFLRPSGMLYGDRSMIRAHHHCTTTTSYHVVLLYCWAGGGALPGASCGTHYVVY